MSDKPTVLPSEPDGVVVPQQPRTIAARLLAIKAAIGALGKDSEMKEGQKYKYRSIDTILEVAHDALIEHGIIIAPVTTQARYEQRSTRAGNPQTLALLDVSWLVKSVDGEQLDPLPATSGEALDTSDKATGKAHTAAYKVLLSQLFAIPYSEHDQDDERPEQGHARRSTEWDPAVRDELFSRWENLPGDLADKVLDRVRNLSKQPELPTPFDLPGDEWPGRIKVILDKAWEAAEAQDGPIGDTADRERMEDDKT